MTKRCSWSGCITTGGGSRLQASRDRGQQFLEELRELLALPHVGDVRGRGLAIGVELVSDKASRKSLFEKFPNLRMDIPRFVRHLHGVIIAVHGSAIALTPPLVMTAGEVTRVVEAVADVLGRVDPQKGVVRI